MRKKSVIAAFALLILLAVGCTGTRVDESVSGGARPHPSSASAEFLRDQLAQLDTLPAPDGVTANEWSALKTALAGSIQTRMATGGKAVLAAPITDSAQSRLRYNLDDGRFDWRIYNPGDYDQNGEVNISDLTPLGARMGQAVPAGPAGANSVLSVVDGDGNGLITIGDITPLGANLGRRITGFNIYQGLILDSLPDSNGAPSELDALHYEPFSAAQGDRTVERLYISVTITPLSPNGLYWVRPIDQLSDTEGTPSTVLDSGEDFTPLLDASPLSGAAPLNVLLSGVFSDNAVSWSFDPEGDGEFTPASDDASITYTYGENGLYSAALRVESAGGQYRSVDALINVGTQPDWRIQTLPQTSPIDPTGIGIIEYHDRPGVVLTYHATLADTYHIASLGSTSPSGSAWLERHLMQVSSSPYGDVILKPVFQRPAVAYKTSSGFAYRNAGATFEDSWGQVETFDSVGSGFGMAVVNLIPFVAFRFDVGNPPVTPTLEVNVSTNIAGDAVWERWVPLQASSTPSQISCAEIDGDRRGITCLNDGQLIYIEGDDDMPPNTWDPPEILATDNIRSFNSLVSLADGSPALVYHSLDQYEQVLFRRASDASGNTWSLLDRVIIDQVPGSGGALVPTAVMVGDIPWAFWVEPTTGLLYFAHATDAEALDWTDADIVGFDPEVDIDETVIPAAADINGHPAVAYATDDNEFKIAMFY